MEQSTKERIFNIFKSVTPTKFENIDVEDEGLYSQITLKSIEIIAVIAALEKEFDIELPPQILFSKSSEEFMEKLLHELENKN